MGINSATVVTNGGVQTQIGVSTAALQALVNSGLASVVGTGSGSGNGGITTTLANTANNQLIQQATTVDIGVSGLSKLIQQSVPVFHHEPPCRPERVSVSAEADSMRIYRGVEKGDQLDT